jgi:2-polyprenyl-3-methyl-5-hydroxy-6-metoxy-1,4-benzoquinol methylase
MKKMILFLNVGHNRLLSKVAKRTFYMRRYVKHVFAHATRRYYFEDDMRVHPEYKDNNYLNHCKFYGFVAQFVKNRRVADVGCGYGYGCEILKDGGASFVSGSDISKTH